MSSLLGDENDITDLKLRGTDGKLVNALRGMLAARSDVFRRMLYGNFAESSQTIVDLGYQGDVLKAVVEFVYSDDAEVLHQKCDESLIFTLVSLVDAGHFFSLDALHSKAESLALYFLTTNSELALAFVVACEAYGDPVSVLRSRALALIRDDPGLLIEREDLLSLMSANQVEEIISDKRLKASEFELFKIVKAWCDNGTDAHHAVRESHETRKTNASHILKHVRLEFIDPVDLCTLVASSGLVAAEDLCEAYQRQVMLAKVHLSADFSKPRHAYGWMSSGKDNFSSATPFHSTELLKSVVLKNGVYKWSIRFDKVCHLAWLGVASMAFPCKGNRWLGHQAGGWVYGSNGAAYHGNFCSSSPGTLPKFDKGSVVTMIFDLRGEQSSLYALVNDGPVFLVFSDMNSGISQTEGFVPAVSLCIPGEVTILGLGRLPPTLADAILAEAS